MVAAWALSMPCRRRPSPSMRAWCSSSPRSRSCSRLWILPKSEQVSCRSAMSSCCASCSLARRAAASSSSSARHVNSRSRPALLLAAQAAASASLRCLSVLARLTAAGYSCGCSTSSSSSSEPAASCRWSWEQSMSAAAIIVSSPPCCTSEAASWSSSCCRPTMPAGSQGSMVGSSLLKAPSSSLLTATFLHWCARRLLGRLIASYLRKAPPHNLQVS